MADDKNGFSIPKTISLGNILQMIVMMIGGAAVWAQLEITNAKQDQRLYDLERRVLSIEAQRDLASAALQRDLGEIARRLATIEGYLRRAAPSDGK